MKNLKTLQYNAGHCRAATAELEHKLHTENIDIALISEQYTYQYMAIPKSRVKGL